MRDAVVGERQPELIAHELDIAMNRLRGHLEFARKREAVRMAASASCPWIAIIRASGGRDAIAPRDFLKNFSPLDSQCPMQDIKSTQDYETLHHPAQSAPQSALRRLSAARAAALRPPPYA